MIRLSEFTIMREPGEHSVILDGSYSVLDLYWLSQDILAGYPKLTSAGDIKIHAYDGDSFIVWWVVE